MGSSWNFSARASPSYEDSGSSEPELGQFNFRAETELTFPTICMSKYGNSNQFHDHLLANKLNLT